MIFLLKLVAYSLIITGVIAALFHLFVGRCELVSYYKSINSDLNIKKLSIFEGFIGITFGILLLILTNLSPNMRGLMIFPLVMLAIIYIPLRAKCLQ